MEYKTLKQTSDKHLYFCVGCKQVHYDRDYSKEDGDLEIISWDKFLESVEKYKDTILAKSEVNPNGGKT